MKASEDETKRKAAEFKRKRKQLKLSQDEVANSLGQSQATISLWENGVKPIPDHAKAWLEGLPSGDFGTASVSAGLPRESKLYSMPTGEFRARWGRCPHKATKVALEAVIWPSAPGFADARVTKTFVKLEARTEPFYEDILGLPPPRSPADRDKTAGLIQLDLDQASIVTLTSFRADRDRAKMTLIDTRTTIGPHALALEINRADGQETITLEIAGERAIRVGENERDAIGIPIYESFAVEAIEVATTFVDLVPDPDPPCAEVYLLRRTGVRSCPDIFGNDPGAVASVGVGVAVEVEVERKGKRPLKRKGVRYAFGPLARPIPGYGYTLAWAGLRPR